MNVIRNRVFQVANKSLTSRGVFSLKPCLHQSVLHHSEISQNQVETDKLYRMIELEMKAYDPAVLKSYEFFATMAARELGVTVGECWTPNRPDHARLTLLKCVHIFKKHRVQYEVRTYYRFVQLLRLTGSTADTLLEYLERNLPESVGLKVTKVGIEPLPEFIKEHSKPEAQINST